MRFKCIRCAKCCGDTEEKVRKILLLESEARRIAFQTSRAVKDFAERVEDSQPYAYQMVKTEAGKCIFLKNNSCSIYPIRPLICKFYPFELKKDSNGEYAFTYTSECPAIGKGPELRRNYYEKLFKKLIKEMKSQ